MVSILNIKQNINKDSFLLKIKKLDPYKCAFCSVKKDIVAIEHIFWECELNDFSTLKKRNIHSN